MSELESLRGEKPFEGLGAEHEQCAGGADDDRSEDSRRSRRTVEGGASAGRGGRSTMREDSVGGAGRQEVCVSLSLADSQDEDSDSQDESENLGGWTFRSSCFLLLALGLSLVAVLAGVFFILLSTAGNENTPVASPDPGPPGISTKPTGGSTSPSIVPSEEEVPSTPPPAEVLSISPAPAPAASAQNPSPACALQWLPARLPHHLLGVRIDIPDAQDAINAPSANKLREILADFNIENVRQGSLILLLPDSDNKGTPRGYQTALGLFRRVRAIYEETTVQLVVQTPPLSLAGRAQKPSKCGGYRVGPSLDNHILLR